MSFENAVDYAQHNGFPNAKTRVSPDQTSLVAGGVGSEVIITTRSDGEGFVDAKAVRNAVAAKRPDIARYLKPMGAHA